MQWTDICARAGVETADFTAAPLYPDDVTHRLIGAAADTLGLTVQETLEALGEHMVLHGLRVHYGELLALGGRTLRDFLLNLENLHTRLHLVQPQMEIPLLYCVGAPEGGLCLHYHSHCPELAPLVVGMLKGLSQVFRTPVQVTRQAAREQGAEHDEFLIQFQAA